MLLLLLIVLLVLGVVLAKKGISKGSIFYAAFAVLCSFAVLIPFGYAMAHGGEGLVWALPAVSIFFMLPFGIKRFSCVPNWCKKAAFFVPVMVVAAPLLFFLIIQPSYQKYHYKSLLKQVVISDVVETPFLAPSGEVIGAELSYKLHLPKPLHIAEHSIDFSPIHFPESSVSGMEQMNLVITRNGLKVEDSLRTDIPSGHYAVSQRFLVHGLSVDKEHGMCKRSEDAWMKEIMQKLSSASSITPELSIVSRVDIPNRMGMFYYDFHKKPLSLTLSGQDVMRAIQRFPVCSNPN